MGLRLVSPRRKSRWRCCAYRGPRGSAACCCQRHGAELLLNGKALAPDCRQGKQKQKWCIWREPAVPQPQCARCCRGSCAWDSSPFLIPSVYFSFFLPLPSLLYFFFPLSVPPFHREKNRAAHAPLYFISLPHLLLQAPHYPISALSVLSEVCFCAVPANNLRNKHRTNGPQ